jgi:SAM-dependent methyltransferase
MDLNPSSLAAASRRDSAIKIKECIQHDVFETIPIKYHAKFDSISMFYLLHCLPGTLKEKERVIVNVANALKPDGTLYGATILGDSAAHNRFGNKLMKIYNSKGIFSNREDSEQDLHSVLSSNFVDVNVVRVGKVVIFSAKGRALKQRLA